MATAGCNETTQRIALLDRVSDLFDRFGGLVPLAIAFLNGWPNRRRRPSESHRMAASFSAQSRAVHERKPGSVRRRDPRSR
nr:hypothetical protein FJN17_22785 [Bradyrhizobium symbiodeficiens]